MTDIRPQIAMKIRLASHRHSQGDWEAANEELGRLRLMAMALDIRTLRMGNEMCANHLSAEFDA
jgi:hypothetical protein